MVYWHKISMELKKKHQLWGKYLTNELKLNGNILHADSHHESICKLKIVSLKPIFEQQTYE